jgi:hypothetical protein
MDLIMVGKSVLQKWRSSINIVLPIYSKKAEILKSGHNMTGKAPSPKTSYCRRAKKVAGNSIELTL